MFTAIADALFSASGHGARSIDYDAIRRKRERDRQADAEFLRRWNKQTGHW